MRFIVFCLLLWVSSGLAWAGGALQGTVKDSAGHPIKGAEVRIEGKNFAKAVKSDAKGHYFSDGLAIGTNYKVTVVVNGSVKASTPDVRARAEKVTDLNFDLRSASNSKKTHMVWVTTESGTHIGPANGYWVEVDENGQVVNKVNQDVERMGSNYAKTLENSKTNAAVGK